MLRNEKVVDVNAGEMDCFGAVAMARDKNLLDSDGRRTCTG